MRDDRVIDLFAGPGGWDEGVRALGLRPVGVEWDAAACQTAMAAGHVRFQHDIAALDPREFAAGVFDGPVRGLIASPPCQGFSQAGKQKGRKDAHPLLAAIPEMVKRDVRPELRESMTDSRSILVLEPLRWALALTPSWMAWEQVPAVLPIWEACADVLRSLGYTVATGNLSSEQYGVPQTRKRAILVARAPWMTAAMGPAALPEPTHSRYYPRNPAKLDQGVLPWVSMAEALGWGMTARPFPTVCHGSGRRAPDMTLLGGSGARTTVYGERDAGRWQGGVAPSMTKPMGAGMVERHGDRSPREADEPAFTITAYTPLRWAPSDLVGFPRKADDRGEAIEIDGEAYRARDLRSADEPAQAVTEKVRSWQRFPEDSGLADDQRDDARFTPINPRPNGATRSGDQPAATLIGGPPHWVFVGGTGENATKRTDDQPAPTVHFGERLNTVEWAVAPAEGDALADWPANRPATTVVGSYHPEIVSAPGYRTSVSRQNATGAIRVTINEAAVLQSFPADYPFQGTKTAQYRQVGDAVPPGLALAVVSAVSGIRLAKPEEGPWPFRAEPDDEGAA